MTRAAIPVVVLIPGSFAPLTVFSYFIPHLRNAGFEVVVASLDSANPSNPRMAGPVKDAESIRERLVAPLVEQHGHQVILCSHSYGGMLAAGASQGLSQRQRARRGLPGGVLGFVYLAAFLPTNGCSLQDLLGGRDPPRMSLNDPRPGLARVLLDPATGLKSSQTHAMAAFTASSPEQDWLSDEYEGRRVYVRAMADESLPPKFQQAFVEQSGVRWDVVEVNAPHDIYDHAQGELVGLFQRCARQWTGSLQQ